MENKVRYNLKNVHYAPLTVDEQGAASYGAPKAIPGAVSIALTAEGEITPFYADGLVYFNSVANNGYSGDLEMALITDDFRVDILKEELDADAKVLIENARAQAQPFALLFEFDGDQKSIRHILYNCSATRPSMEGGTTTETVEPNTETLTISATALENGMVKAKTGEETTDEVYTDWYQSVWMPA